MSICPVRIYPHMIFGNQVVGREYTSSGSTGRMPFNGTLPPFYLHPAARTITPSAMTAGSTSGRTRLLRRRWACEIVQR